MVSLHLQLRARAQNLRGLLVNSDRRNTVAFTKSSFSFAQESHRLGETVLVHCHLAIGLGFNLAHLLAMRVISKGLEGLICSREIIFVKVSSRLARFPANAIEFRQRRKFLEC